MFTGRSRRGARTAVCAVAGALLTLLLPLLLASPAGGQPSEVTVGTYEPASQTRLVRTVCQYTYKASTTSLSPAFLKNTTATLTSSSPSTMVADGLFTFGDVPSSATGKSADAFVIGHNRLYAFDWAKLSWTPRCDQRFGPLLLSFQETSQTEQEG